MAKVIQFPQGPSCIGGRDYLALLIESEKKYRADRAPHGIFHHRTIPVPLELAEAILAILDERGVT